MVDEEQTTDDAGIDGGIADSSKDTPQAPSPAEKAASAIQKVSYVDHLKYQNLSSALIG